MKKGKSFIIASNKLEQVKSLFTWADGCFEIVSGYFSDKEIAITFDVDVEDTDIYIILSSILDMVEVLFKEPVVDILTIFDSDNEIVTTNFLDLD